MMDVIGEIAKIVAEKAKISQDSARIAVKVVLEQVAERLPDPLGNQLESLLGTKQAGSMDLGGMAGMLGGLGDILGGGKK
ncbi:MAG TPA: hypothetical protein PK299_09045 [Anaerolineales bacterium]|nr:hypothetical protein [Anaerolineales bacterium]